MSAPCSETDDTAEGVRLSRRVAELKGCSRREAEQYIEGGWVRVAGQVVETPQHRVHGESILIDPRASLGAPTPVTLLLNMPPGEVTHTGQPADGTALGLLATETQAKTDRSGIVPLRRHFNRQRLCVPLESHASGLTVFTQDKHIARRLTEDAAWIEQEFNVDVEGTVSPTQLGPRQGPVPGAAAMPPARVSLASTQPARTTLRFAVKGHHPGLVEAWCEQAELHVCGIRRIRIGRIPLAGLPSGQWRYLLPHERF